LSAETAPLLLISQRAFSPRLGMAQQKPSVWRLEAYGRASLCGQDGHPL